ncbi:MAG: nucleoside deaminase [Bacteroidales bacterium]
MNKDFLIKAIELAKENVKNSIGGPFGAVIVKDGNIIATGTNSVTSSKDPTAHAEINAIRKACKVLKNFCLEGCEIYSSCEPCPMCLSAIYWAKINKIYYSADQHDASFGGFDDSYIYHEITLNKSERSIKAEQFLKTKGKEPFKMWNNTKDKIKY